MTTAPPSRLARPRSVPNTRITPSGKQQRVQSCRSDWTEQGAPMTLKISDEAPLSYPVPQGASAIIEIR
jgi:hypothetical protein